MISRACGNPFPCSKCLQISFLIPRPGAQLKASDVVCLKMMDLRSISETFYKVTALDNDFTV